MGNMRLGASSDARHAVDAPAGSERKVGVLYLSYTGMLEPLGKSQVLAYLKCMADECAFTLVSFEKRADRQTPGAEEALERECADLGIRWQPRTYHHRPRLLATAWDLSSLLWATLRHSRQDDIQLVHCRSYIPAMAACLAGLVTGKPFVFDMRALWPDEMVTAGRLRAASPTYKALKWAERRLLRRADAVVSLTRAGVDELVARYPEVPRGKFQVITTCVDVERFRDSERSTIEHSKSNKSFVVGITGTLLSGWFHLNESLAFVAALKSRLPGTRLSIVTRDDHETIMSHAQRAGLEARDVSIASANPDEMPAYLAEMDAGVMFFAEKPGSAPTRLGEFLAAGIPVVGNSGIGDLGELIERYGVGVVVEDPRRPELLERAVDALLERYEGIRASRACRRAAEDYFSVTNGAAKYRGIYRRLVSDEARAGVSAARPQSLPTRIRAHDEG